MKTYLFQVIVEPDEDVWHAYCPALKAKGAATWGMTREEALIHINEVVKLVVESMAAHGEALPDGPDDEVRLLPETAVAVAV